MNRGAHIGCPSGTIQSRIDSKIVPEGRSILAHRFNGGITDFPILFVPEGRSIEHGLHPVRSEPDTGDNIAPQSTLSIAERVMLS